MTLIDQYREFARPHVVRAVQAMDDSAEPFDPAAFVDAMLAECPPLSGMSNYDAGKVIMRLGSAALDDRARRNASEADEMNRIVKLAQASGCPEDVPVLPFLEERGLIQVATDGRITFAADVGPRSP